MSKPMTEQQIQVLWRERRWPEIDPPGFTFIGRAIEQLGSATFGELWTGTEPATPTLPPIKSTLTGSEAAKDLFLRLEANNIAALERWATVRRALLKALLDGNLGSAVRWGNGQMRAVEPLTWNTDRAANDLRTCQLSQVGEWAVVRLPAYLVTDDLTALLAGREPSDKPDWWPAAGDTAKSWFNGPSAVAIRAEARRRARLAVANPGTTDESRALVVMWCESGGKELTWKTFEQYIHAS